MRKILHLWVSCALSIPFHERAINRVSMKLYTEKKNLLTQIGGAFGCMQLCCCSSSIVLAMRPTVLSSLAQHSIQAETPAIAHSSALHFSLLFSPLWLSFIVFFIILITLNYFCRSSLPFSLLSFLVPIFFFVQSKLCVSVSSAFCFRMVFGSCETVVSAAS